MEKDFKTVEEQIILLKERGIVINDESAIEFKNLYTVLLNNLEDLKKDIKSIEYNKILNKMGFPKNYKKLLEYIS